MGPVGNGLPLLLEGKDTRELREAKDRPKPMMLASGLGVQPILSLLVGSFSRRVVVYYRAKPPVEAVAEVPSGGPAIAQMDDHPTAAKRRMLTAEVSSSSCPPSQ